MTERTEFRRRVLAAFEASLRDRIASALGEIRTLDEAAAGETKSSAGDKYETSREMFAQARDLQRSLLAEAEVQMDWVRRQDPSAVRAAAGPGSLLETSGGWFLLGPVPLEVLVDGTCVQGLSLQGPLGRELRGAVAGEVREFRGRTHAIRTVL